MGQKQMGDTLRNEAACIDSLTDMAQNESVLILIKHCRDMKQQETCLRLITLLLLLSCMTLFIFTTGADLWQHGNSRSRGQTSATVPSPVYSKQQSMCPTDDTPSKPKLHIALRSVPTGNTSDGQYLKWNVHFGEKYNEAKRAIVIQERGIYFVYLRIALSCHGGEAAGKFRGLSAWLQKWNENYDQNFPLMDIQDGVVCVPEGFRSVSVGQLFELLEGDHVRVWIDYGYKLITKSSFGAYRV